MNYDFFPDRRRPDRRRKERRSATTTEDILCRRVFGDRRKQPVAVAPPAPWQPADDSAARPECDNLVSDGDIASTLASACVD